MEGELASFKGALLVISHDRTFLNSLTRSTLWLDRGRMQRLDKSFAHFEAWAEELLDSAKPRSSIKLDRQIVREEKLAAARRHRPAQAQSGPPRAPAGSLRQANAPGCAQPGTAKLAVATSRRRSGDLVIEAKEIAKNYPAPRTAPTSPVLKSFSTRIKPRRPHGHHRAQRRRQIDPGQDADRDAEPGQTAS